MISRFSDFFSKTILFSCKNTKDSLIMQENHGSFSFPFAFPYSK